MNIQKTISRKYKKIKDNKGGIFSLLGVSLIIFVLCAAVYVVGDYVAAGYSDESSVSLWNYSYTENAGVVPKSELRIMNAQNPIVTDSDVRKPNIYFTKTFDPMKKAKTLIIRTDHSPVMIKVNGNEVYNNQFDTSQYVGNCYNAIKLEASERDQEVEVFLKIPLSVRFEASFSGSTNTSMDITGGLIAGGCLLALALISLLIVAVLSIKRHKLYRSFYAAALLTYVGIVLTLINISEVTFLFNAPFWLNIKTAFSHLTLIAGAACIAARGVDRKKYLKKAIIAAAVVLAAVFASVNPILFVCAEALISLTALAYTVYCAYGVVEFVLKRTMYAIPAFVICAFYSMVALFSGLFLLSRASSMYAYAISLPTIVLIGVLEYINIADYQYAKKNSDLKEQTAHYSDSVDNIAHFIRNMLMCDDRSTFFDTAVKEVSELLQKYYQENNALRYCVGVKTENGYEEVINNDISACRYELIEKNCTANAKDCVFSETYLDFALKKEDGISAVIHFENIVNGLDLFFISMMEAAYCGLETAYEKVFDEQHSFQLDVIFTELAENSEVDNGYSPEHLIHIAEYVYILCRKLGMNEEESKRISLASKLHDIGKIAIPKSILNKEGRLTQEEQVIVSCHAKFGYLILSAYSEDPLLSDAAVIARYHHERYDGTGTNELKGEEIPLIARITTVCDVYDALVSVRPYKQAWSKDKARSFMTENSGVMFDPEIVDVFLKSLDDNEQEAE